MKSHSKRPPVEMNAITKKKMINLIRTIRMEQKNVGREKYENSLVFASGVSGKNSRLTGAKLHGVVGADELPLLKFPLAAKFS